MKRDANRSIRSVFETFVGEACKATLAEDRRCKNFDRVAARHACGPLDVPATGLAVTDDKVWFRLLHLIKQRLADGDSNLMFVPVVSIGAGNTSAVGFGELDREFWHQTKKLRRG